MVCGCDLVRFRHPFWHPDSGPSVGMSWRVRPHSKPNTAAWYVFGIVLVLVWVPLHWLGSVGAVGGVRVWFRKTPPFCVPGSGPSVGTSQACVAAQHAKHEQHGTFSELWECWCGCHCIGWARWVRWVVCGCDLVRFLTPILAPGFRPAGGHVMACAVAQ